MYIGRNWQEIFPGLNSIKDKGQVPHCFDFNKYFTIMNIFCFLGEKGYIYLGRVFSNFDIVQQLFEAFED